MEYRRLGNAGMKVSTIALGGWINYGEGKVAADTAREVVLVCGLVAVQAGTITVRAQHFGKQAGPPVLHGNDRDVPPGAVVGHGDPDAALVDVHGQPDVVSGNVSYGRF